MLVGTVSALRPPTPAVCQAAYNQIGDNGLLMRLSPCQSGPSAECCRVSNELAGINPGV